MIRHCPKCKTDHPIEAFGINRRRKDGISCWCKPCCRQNIARIRATPEGKLKHLQQEKARYAADPEKGRKRSREWHDANRERARDNAKRKYEENKAHPDFRSQERIRQRAIYQRNPGKGVAKVRARQISKISAEPKWLTSIQKIQTKAVYDLAAILTADSGIKYHVDHIVPLRGANFSGLHVPWNLEAVPAAVNCSKANKMPSPDKHRAWDCA